MKYLLILSFALVMQSSVTVASTSTLPTRHTEYPTYYAHVNGINLAYQDFGQPDDEAVLLIMGLGGQLIHWEDDFVLTLVENGYRVIRFDNRDAGWSTKLFDAGKPGLFTLLRYKLGLPLGAPYTLDDMANDSLGLLDHLNIDRAHVAGLSMGGMIAQIMASKYPNRVSTLTSIMSTSGDSKLPQSKIQPSLTDVGPERDANIDARADFGQQIDGTVAELTAEQWRARMARAFDRANHKDGVARQLWAIGDSGDRVDLLKQVKQPTLVIHGKADPLIPFQGGEHTAKLVKNAKLVLLEGMGHFIDSVSQPKILAEMLSLYKRHDDGSNSIAVSRVEPQSARTHHIGAALKK